MARKIEETVAAIAQPFVDRLGLILVEVEYNRKKNEASELVLYVDKDGGVTLEDCEALSKALDEPLDREDPIPDSYVLCVSSPGIDRPLQTERDFARALGTQVDVKLYVKKNGKKEFTGTLAEYDEGSILMSTATGIVRLERKDIALIRPHLDFNSILGGDTDEH